MLNRMTLRPAWAAVGLAVLVSTVAWAQMQSPSQRTMFTFSEPVTIPGQTLPAGQYEFAVSEQGDRHVIQVFEKGGSKLITTVFAAPALRNERPKSTELRFLETPAEMSPAIGSWWYIGERTGHEFIYPRAQASLLAKMNPNGVLTGEGRSGDVTRLSQASETKVDMAKPPVDPMVVDTTTPKPPTPVEPPPPQATRPQPPPDNTTPAEPNRDRLPQTASVQPLVLAAGLVLLAVGFLSIAAQRGRRREVL